MKVMKVKAAAVPVLYFWGFFCWKNLRKQSTTLKCQLN